MLQFGFPGKQILRQKRMERRILIRVFSGVYYQSRGRKMVERG
jgi:hypothetical protein